MSGRDDRNIVWNDEGEEVALPTKWEICWTCQGEGTTALHGMVVTLDEWEPEEIEEYFHGTTYDTLCDECGGSGKVKEVDEDRLTPELQRAWDLRVQQDAEMRAERAMGA